MPNPFLSDILSYYLEDKVGVFVEVGADDGVSFSNTYHLAASGWRGMIRACQRICREMLKNHSDHPSVSVIQVAISDKDDELIVMDTAGVFSTASASCPKLQSSSF